MYNLKIGTQRVTNLRLSGENVAEDLHRRDHEVERPGDRGGQPGPDPARAQDRAGRPLGRLRLDGAVHPVDDRDRKARSGRRTAGRCGRSPCAQTSDYPVIPGSGMVAQAGDLGVAGYVSQKQAVGTIGYVEYSYALKAGFPVAKVLNKAGYYTEPTAGHVAVSLLKAQINKDRATRRRT